MKPMKRTLGMLLALMMIVSIPAAALADTYDIANGGIDVIANEDGQTVTQTQWSYDAENDNYTSTVVVDNKPDPAPVITGSSDENAVWIDAAEGSEANVTLKNVDGAAIFVIGEGDATITLEGSNTFDGNPYNPIVFDNGTTTVEGPGSLIGIASGAEENEWMSEMSDDSINTEGIYVGPETTLNVESGSVTGINQNQSLPGLNPGIGFQDGASLKVGDGIKVYDADGKDVTAAAVADPTILNTSAVTSIKSPVINHKLDSSLLEGVETVIKDAEGNEVSGTVQVEIFENGFVQITVRCSAGYTQIVGRVMVKDGQLVFKLSGVEYTLTEDNVLIVPLRFGGTVELKLSDELVKTLLGMF